MMGGDPQKKNIGFWCEDGGWIFFGLTRHANGWRQSKLVYVFFQHFSFE